MKSDEQAGKFGYQKLNSFFIRSVISVADLRVSGNVDDVLDYTDDYEERVKDLLLYKMGLSEKQGVGFHSCALRNMKRKVGKDPNMISWKFRKVMR